MAELLAEGRAANTVRTYRAALSYWEHWHLHRYQRRLPLLESPPAAVPAEHVLQFIVDHAQRSSAAGLKHELPTAIETALVRDGIKARPGAPSLSTLMLRIAVLTKAHALKELSSPTEHGAVRELLKRVRRAYAARGQRARSKKALPKTELQSMLATCDDSLAGLRDRALLLFGWASGGRRRAELAAASLDNLEQLRDGRFLYHLRHGKTLQDGQPDENTAKPIVGAAAEALTAWLRAANINQGRIFRSVRGRRIGASLTGHAIAQIVKARAKAAGLELDVSAHSLRSGFITEAGLQGKPLVEVMRLSGHRSVSQAMAYYQGGNVLNSSIATLFENDPCEVSRGR